MNQAESSERIDLGLAVLATFHRGEKFTCAEIAAWCDCSPERIGQIEREALAKVRNRMRGFADRLSR